MTNTQKAIEKLKDYCEWCRAQGGPCEAYLDGCAVSEALALLQQPTAKPSELIKDIRKQIDMINDLHKQENMPLIIRNGFGSIVAEGIKEFRPLSDTERSTIAYIFNRSRILSEKAESLCSAYVQLAVRCHRVAAHKELI